ncbi:hypothetical protein PR202_ga03168 [Eleusine coracana subsp. coracana]|uniref:Uncharacterized protein n=1 Tax=Eleusine coracana subsp. coracana TaxID=191504 RepID=A0AAV5BPN4_ELECO|nr:hypothetical protein PR202_ga03168 [Eleusine coracana subsp. coracana]
MASSELVALRPADQSMSQWLQIGTPSTAHPLDRAQEKAREAEELRRRWRERCAQLHSHHGRLVPCSEWNGAAASVINSMPAAALPVRSSVHPSGGAVDTDLALGPASTTKPSSCASIDEKLLVRRLTEAVRWQPEAAAAVVSTITKARSSTERRNTRRGGPVTCRSDTWVLFAGPDAAGKRSMAEALSVSVFGVGAVTVHLGGVVVREEEEQAGCEEDSVVVASCRGRTALDRVAEAVRSNPFRVVVLDGVDHADGLVRGAIVRAVECGRLVDSHGRDVSLGGNIFVVMSQWTPSSSSSEQLSHADDSPWNNNLDPTGTGKRRRASEEEPLDGGGDRRTRARRESPRKPLPLDLNLSMSDDHNIGDEDDSGGEGSRNSSSDLTVEHEQQDYRPQPALANNCSSAPPSNVSELMQAVDGTVVFKPAFEAILKRSVSDVAVSASGGELPDRLAAGARTPLETWTNGEVLCPSTIRQFKRSFSTNDVDGATVEGSSARRKDGEVFPMSVTVTVDGN